YREAREKYGNQFRAGMGAEAVRELLRQIDIDALSKELREEVENTTGQRRIRAIRRLEVVEAFRKSGNRPEWMILDVIPVIPPDLRPMVQLDGGRFATSDLNDLYRRVINRNNRLKRLLELGAPDIIVRNEKRMLQEAVDALIDNGRRGRPVTGPGNRPLKSLSDMLKGKQGRFRQNLLGKRVDYSGRSVIVVGPELKLYQCGLPKEMALELFKPFVMKKLVKDGHAHNIKSAKKMVERVRDEVWDVLEEVIQEHPVLLNRAPTLHRLGIQAFEPVLVEGRAIKIHPLVCTAYNADFDGDQMAVHVPLSAEAQAEARLLMLSAHNLLNPKDGRPVVTPTKDMVLGIYYLTSEKEDALGANRVFASREEAIMAHDEGSLAINAPIWVRLAPGTKPEKTTLGRIILNENIPQDLGFVDRSQPGNAHKLEVNAQVERKLLGKIVERCYNKHGSTRTTEILDNIKHLGFKYATLSGISISMSDISVPEAKHEILASADKQVAEIERAFGRGMMSEDERYKEVIDVWTKAGSDVQKALFDSMDKFNPVYMMVMSGARGNFSQITQLGGMRGLMSDPSGRTIELPIKASFHEGLTVLEYFTSTHGARKGAADTAIRTADSGYLTRRLVDVAQDVIVREEDCGTTAGIYVGDIGEDRYIIEPLAERIAGRVAAEDIVMSGYRDPVSGEIQEDEIQLIAKDQMFSDDLAERVANFGVIVAPEEGVLTVDEDRLLIKGVSGKEYVFYKALPDQEVLVADGASVAQGQPLTRGLIRQVKIRSVLTCKSRHGVCVKCYGRNLATGSMVEVGEAIGIIAAQSIGEPGTQLTMRTFHTGGVAGGDDITQGLPRVEELFEVRKPKGQAVISEVAGVVTVEDSKGVRTVHVQTDDGETKSYSIPYGARLRVKDGQVIEAGDELTQGPVNPHELLAVRGIRGVQTYLLQEVQKVYRMQGVEINDKHIEVIVRQMLRKVRVDEMGDTDLLAGSLVDVFEFEEENAHAMEEGGEPAVARPVLLGITKASLATDSFLSAASFQETTRVLTDAAIKGKADPLLGLKENVIIGKLIPAGTGMGDYQHVVLSVANQQEDLVDSDATANYND
ncbi:MAG TPA: DNA-directed RNA polymerase subunit beta', partial [Firmicutes bacterium]|nr:DNA-directed RNA polymerase subunit beta' [Bacillota bacterium]